MKDFVGNELEIGDSVVFMQLRYRNLFYGIITKMSEKTIWISHAKDNMGRTQTKQVPAQVVKINRPKGLENET